MFSITVQICVMFLSGRATSTQSVSECSQLSPLHKMWDQSVLPWMQWMGKSVWGSIWKFVATKKQLHLLAFRSCQLFKVPSQGFDATGHTLKPALTHFWPHDYIYTVNSPCEGSDYVLGTVIKGHPCSCFLTCGNRKKSHGARSGE